ncbi:MAG: efflux RND transporter permease subunit [Woeseiaceae bacterium]|nr:efflux RND transporter permease subunit [Woeseiaceae bacterium]
MRELPDRVEQVVVLKADEDSRAIVNLAVLTDSMIEEEVTRIVEQDIIPELISIEGVADVQLFAARQRMLRVVVDPLRLTSYGLAVTDVADTLRQAPFDVPAGSFRSTTSSSACVPTRRSLPPTRSRTWSSATRYASAMSPTSGSGPRTHAPTRG